MEAQEFLLVLLALFYLDNQFIFGLQKHFSPFFDPFFQVVVRIFQRLLDLNALDGGAELQCGGFQHVDFIVVEPVRFPVCDVNQTQRAVSGPDGDQGDGFVTEAIAGVAHKTLLIL